MSLQKVLRIEVTDTRGDALPVRERAAAGPAESGYGLLLVEELADRWGVRGGPTPCKTVWAELDPSRPGRGTNPGRRADCTSAKASAGRA